ncbi:MAG: aminoacyl-histidine dipeptidase [Bacteroidales bacterium]|nr:aminoacyl-histidine dipeptidase [Bacteroidales bacterium]
MSKEILNLEPKALWKNFYNLTQIPRPSKHEAQVTKYMKEWGENLGLETIVDEVGNVIIKKPATPGMENRKTVCLQSHLDMVPQKENDFDFDFEKDPIDAYIDGEWVTANKTTLGADDGLGDAAAMAILESTDIPHGPIECLFTVDEETGMTGAFALKPGLLDAEILLNLDSEAEGELYIGCAGGTNATIKFDYKKENVPENSVAKKIIIKGLKGGHSGLDIPLGRGNANKLLNRFLRFTVKEHNARLAYFDGGSLRNAIPRDAYAIVTLPKNSEEAFNKSIAEYEEIFKKELSAVEPNLTFEYEDAKNPEFVIDEDTQNRFIAAVYGYPNGVIRMSDSMPIVETSTNLASIKTDDNTITILCLLRSSVDSAKKDLGEMFRCISEIAGAEIILDGEYPGWKPNIDSPILKHMKNVYNNLFGKIPEIMAIHAGLECGLIKSVYPKMDAISFGPTIMYPHSPDEKCHIDSVKKFYEFLVETLKQIPLK